MGEAADCGELWMVERLIIERAQAIVQNKQYQKIQIRRQDTYYIDVKRGLKRNAQREARQALGEICRRQLARWRPGVTCATTRGAELKRWSAHPLSATEIW